MILKQYYLGCLSHASYLIADEQTGTAAVVDPQRDVDQYLDDAAAQGWSIRHVLLTHFHADFLAGHLELRERCGASIHIGERAEAEFDFTPMQDGGTLEMGRVRLGFLETPGHTPEGVSILVYDLEKSADAPHAVLTGDTLFIGDVGRPDLMASIGITAEELAGMMYDSLHGKLMKLPDDTLVYPAHGAGSMCGKNLSTDTVSTIGAQRRGNPSLRPMERAAFIRMLTGGQPEAPAYFAFDALLNRQERPTLEASLEQALRPMSLESLLNRQQAGAVVLDARDPDAFAAGHLRGSVNIGLGGSYATWAGTMLRPGQEIVLVAEPGREREAATRLGRIGFDSVAGYLEGGPAAFAGQVDLLARIERIDVMELARRLQGQPGPVILDVRGPGEWQQRRLPGSLHVPLNRLERLLDQVPRDRDLAVLCGSGYRSSLACSLLAARGYSRLADVRGGIQSWTGPTESDVLC